MTRAVVTVMLKPGVLDPQGRAIAQALAGLGFTGLGEVRAGKVIELELTEPDPARAQEQATEMATRLLANPVIESYSIEILSPPPLEGGGRGEGCHPTDVRSPDPTE